MGFINVFKSSAVEIVLKHETSRLRSTWQSRLSNRVLVLIWECAVIALSNRAQSRLFDEKWRDEWLKIDFNTIVKSRAVEIVLKRKASRLRSTWPSNLSNRAQSRLFDEKRRDEWLRMWFINVFKSSAVEIVLKQKASRLRSTWPSNLSNRAQSRLFKEKILHHRTTWVIKLF